MTYDEFCEKIINQVPFAFSRWGDGEWYTVDKRKGQNCDGNIYYPDLGDELLKIVSVKQEYYMAKQQDGPCFSLAKNFNQDWILGCVLHEASQRGELHKIFKVLQSVIVVYIGNSSLKALPFINKFIEIPPNNVWLNRDHVMDQIRQTFSDQHQVYCFSAGMCSNVFIHKLWLENPKNTYIDVGSVFDPYVGRKTRDYHHTLKLETLE